MICSCSANCHKKFESTPSRTSSLPGDRPMMRAWKSMATSMSPNDANQEQASSANCMSSFTDAECRWLSRQVNLKGQITLKLRTLSARGDRKWVHRNGWFLGSGGLERHGYSFPLHYREGADCKPIWLLQLVRISGGSGMTLKHFQAFINASINWNQCNVKVKSLKSMIFTVIQRIWQQRRLAGKKSMFGQ